MSARRFSLDDFEWSPNVENILSQIAILSSDDKGLFFCCLERRYPFIFAKVDQPPNDVQKPWHDPRYLFSQMQKRLLNYLDGKGVVNERQAIQFLWRIGLHHSSIWPKEMREKLGKHGITQAGVESAARKRYAQARANLRRLAKSTNTKLYKMKLNWKVWRPKNNHLVLDYCQKFL